MLRLSWAIVRKDLALGLAGESGFLQACLLGVLLVFIFSLGSGDEPTPPRAGAAVFWLCSVICQSQLLGRLYALEDQGAREQLALCGSPVQAVWLGKALAALILLFGVQLALLAALALFLELYPQAPFLWSVATLVLIDTGVCLLGSILGAIGHGRQSLLGLLLLPLLSPLLLAAVGLGEQCLAWLTQERELALVSLSWDWLRLASAFDAIYAASGLALFSFVYPGDG